MAKKLNNIPVTMDDGLLREIDDLAERRGDTRSSLMRFAIKKGLESLKAGEDAVAVQLTGSHHAALKQAARVTGLSSQALSDQVFSLGLVVWAWRNSRSLRFEDREGYPADLINLIGEAERSVWEMIRGKDNEEISLLAEKAAKGGPRAAWELAQQAKRMLLRLEDELHALGRAVRVRHPKRERSSEAEIKAAEDALKRVFYAILDELAGIQSEGNETDPDFFRRFERITSPYFEIIVRKPTAPTSSQADLEPQPAARLKRKRKGAPGE